MRIVSQNKECDVNYDTANIYCQKIDDDYIIQAIIQSFEKGNRYIMLGIYKSDERCLEVMESIRNSYIHDSKVFLMPEE